MSKLTCESFYGNVAWKLTKRKTALPSEIGMPKPCNNNREDIPARRAMMMEQQPYEEGSILENTPKHGSFEEGQNL